MHRTDPYCAVGSFGPAEFAATRRTRDAWGHGKPMIPSPSWLVRLPLEHHSHHKSSHTTTRDWQHTPQHTTTPPPLHRQCWLATACFKRVGLMREPCGHAHEFDGTRSLRGERPPPTLTRRRFPMSRGGERRSIDRSSIDRMPRGARAGSDVERGERDVVFAHFRCRAWRAGCRLRRGSACHSSRSAW